MRIEFDDKLKKHLRDNGYDKVYITRGIVKGERTMCVYVFPEHEWKRQEQKFNSLFPNQEERARMNKLFFSHAKKSNLSNRNYEYITIPKVFEKWLGTGGDIDIVIKDNKLAIYSKG